MAAREALPPVHHADVGAGALEVLVNRIVKDAGRDVPVRPAAAEEVRPRPPHHQLDRVGQDAIERQEEGDHTDAGDEVQEGRGDVAVRVLLVRLAAAAVKEAPGNVGDDHGGDGHEEDHRPDVEDWHVAGRVGVAVEPCLLFLDYSERDKGAQ